MTVKVICHPVTGRSKGYGFVKFSSETEAAAAFEKMNNEVNSASYIFRYSTCQVRAGYFAVPGAVLDRKSVV